MLALAFPCLPMHTHVPPCIPMHHAHPCLPMHAHALQVRVRVAVGDCLQVLAQLRGGQVLEQCVERVMLSIHEHYVGISVISVIFVFRAAC